MQYVLSRMVKLIGGTYNTLNTLLKLNFYLNQKLVPIRIILCCQWSIIENSYILRTQYCTKHIILNKVNIIITTKLMNRYEISWIITIMNYFSLCSVNYALVNTSKLVYMPR